MRDSRPPSPGPGPGPAPAADRSPLTLTKLAAPRTRFEHIERPHLLAPLVDGGQRLTVVDAPAGYGKTTLLASWQRADDRGPFAWLSLDEGDGDPLRFWAYVTAAVRLAAAPTAAVGPSGAGLGAPGITEVVLPRLINEIASLPRALVLVLDDYHRLRSDDVDGQLSVLLERGPPNLQVAISTRTGLSLPLARLRAGGELVELGARELSFAADEAGHFLNDRLGLGLSDAGVGRLVERTEGWPAGLYLAGLALAESPDRAAEVERFASGDRHVMDYFVTEVLADLDPDERAFLRRAAILSEISGPLLDFVLDTKGSALRLRRLEHSNLLFLRLEGEPEWYRLHAIFGRLLADMVVEEEPEVVSRLHLRASEWYAEHGVPSRAIEHALASGRTDIAAELIAAEWQPIGDFTRNQSFASWLSALPDERIAADPRLALAAAWTAGWGGIEGSWRDWLDRIEAAPEPVALPLGLPSVEAGAVLTRAVFSYDDVGHHLEAAREAAALFEDAPALRTVADGSLGVALYHAGLLTEARDHLAESVDRLAADFPPMLPAALAYLSLTFTAGGEAGEGLSCAELAHARSLDVSDPRHGGSDGIVELAAGAALRALDRPTEALEALDAAIGLLSDETMTLDLAQTRIERSLALLALGRRSAAAVELHQAAGILAQCPDPGAVGIRLREVTEQAGAAHGPRAAAPLSERELEILALLPGGLSRRELAASLYVSFNTVQTHLRSIYRKLGVASRMQAVERARELGLLEADPTHPR
jgi:LuxR family transcriptional regulator, maltose regulon positive regulatory protein